MNIVLTGKPGSGKTSVCLKILENCNLRMLSPGGVLTPANSDGSRHIINVYTRKSIPFCRLEPFPEGPAVGKFFFSKRAFDFGIKAVSRSLDKRNALTFIDELGPLELYGSGFADIFPKLNTSEIKNLLLVIRSSILDKMVRKFDFTFSIVENTIKNRDRLAKQIIELLDS